MQIQIFAPGVDIPDPLRAYVEQQLNSVLEHLQERLTRVEVHLKDTNGNLKNGVDKRCLLEARPRGLDPVAVDHDATEFKDAVHQAVLKLERALQHRFGRLKDH